MSFIVPNTPVYSEAARMVLLHDLQMDVSQDMHYLKMVLNGDFTGDGLSDMLDTMTEYLDHSVTLLYRHELYFGNLAG